MADQVPGTPGQDPNAQPTTITTAAPPPANAIPWLQGADELTVGYVQNKGWKEPAQVLDSYRNLEKLFGADKAGHTVVLPKDDAPQAEKDAFYSRLGRPATVDGYKIPVPEGADPTFAKTAAQWFYEHGVPQKAAEGIAGKWNEFVKAQADAAETERVTRYENDDRELRKEWGAAFDQNLEQARAFARTAGLDDKTLDQLQEGMGHAKLMKFMQTLGAKMGEATFVAGDPAANRGTALTPAQAKDKINTLMADKEWSAKYLGGNADCKAEMERLHRYAYPPVQR